MGKHLGTNLSALASVTALAITGCNSNHNGQVDAPVIVIPDAPADASVDVAVDAPPNYDFSCLGNSEPSDGTATVTLGGIVTKFDVMGFPPMPSMGPLVGGTVDVCRENCANGNKLDTQTTDTQGSYTSSAMSTTGSPPLLDAYIRLSMSGYRTTTEYPASPFTKDTSPIPGFVLSTSAFTAADAYLHGAFPSQNDGVNGAVGLAVTDCANVPVVGATVTIRQNGQDVGEVFDAGNFSPMGAGAFLAFNVPAGATDVGATYNGMTFRTHTILVVKAQTAGTQIRPGF